MEHEIIDFCEFFMKDGLALLGVTEFYQYQKNFLTTCAVDKRVAGLWCRQSGKSTCIAAYSLYMCLTKPNFKIMMVAPTQDQSSELYLKLRTIAEGSHMVREQIESSSQTEINFENGSRVKALPCGPEGATIRGYTADTVIIEEAEGIKDQIVNEVITPMIGSIKSFGQIIKIGTPKGKNHFYRSCYGRDTRYKLYHNDWRVVLKAGQYKKEFIEEQKLELTELEFATEYEAKFISDSDAYFKQDLIDSCVDNDYIMEQYHPKSLFILGVDFARMGEDKTVFIVVEKLQSGDIRVVEILETEKKLMTDSIGRVKLLDEKWHRFEHMYLDQTGMGSGPTDVLCEALGAYRVTGMTFSMRSKQDLYSNLKRLMEQGRLKFPGNRKLLYELADLRYEVASSGDLKIHHSERGHDDYCDALALACWWFKENETSNYEAFIQ